ncbi:phytosulfokines 4 [Brachypodium distachyon]|nr:phytosulfokines 4 [Brachypodium distachyon]|eukprot:XP_003558440.3 phytosulfokines 4 [Brachypodium distachyon]
MLMLLYSQSHLITQRAREMASFSKQATVFLVAALLLCLLCTRGQAARPGPVSSVYTSQGAKSAIAHEKRAAGTRMEMGQEDQALATRECEGGEGTEECLMRRTLVAHTDYIYTQGKHN